RTCASPGSLHDALPIWAHCKHPRVGMPVDHITKDIRLVVRRVPDTIVIAIRARVITPIIPATIFCERVWAVAPLRSLKGRLPDLDRKSTRLNSSHVAIS